MALHIWNLRKLRRIENITTAMFSKTLTLSSHILCLTNWKASGQWTEEIYWNARDKNESCRVRTLWVWVLAWWIMNPSTLGGQGRWITWGQEFETSLPTWQNPISTKNTKIREAWWCAPEIPTTGEAEGGEWLELGRQRLQWGKIMPLHSSLGDKSETLSQKNK